MLKRLGGVDMVKTAPKKTEWRLCRNNKPACLDCYRKCDNFPTKGCRSCVDAKNQFYEDIGKPAYPKNIINENKVYEEAKHGKDDSYMCRSPF